MNVNAPLKFDVERGHFTKVDHLRATDRVPEQYIYEYNLMDYASINDNSSRVGTLYLTEDRVNFVDYRRGSIHLFELKPHSVTMKRKYGDQVFQFQEQIETWKKYLQFDLDVAKHLLAFLDAFYPRVDA